MIQYKYEAVTKSGITVNGVITAHDEGDAVIRLKETCAVVNKLTEVKEGVKLPESLAHRKVNEKNLALMCKQLSIILTAGLPIVRTVELVSKQTNDRALKKILNDVADDVVAGYGLAASFELRGPTLPATFIDTVRAGEESGSLEKVFARLSDYYTKRAKMRGKVISALTYPVFVICVAVVVIIVIMAYAVPTFTATFTAMGTELPLVTKILIAISNFFNSYILILLAMIALIVLGVRLYGTTEKGRVALSGFKLRLPVLGRVNLMNSVSQFANTFSAMLATGLPVLRALTVTGRAMSNYRMSKATVDSVTGITSGHRIAECLRAAGCFPELLIEMTAVGEETGSLEETLAVVGEYYDNEVEMATSRALSLLEPTIICVLAVFVVFVLLAVYLPMFSLYGSIG